MKVQRRNLEFVLVLLPSLHMPRKREYIKVALDQKAAVTMLIQLF
jgi:hypothetical protein